MVRAFEREDFNYWKFIRNRLVRLWPLAIMICAVSLLFGYFYMLPSNYKNVSETALGTLFFLNNFVQYITAGDYWDVSNDYKPLMHTWYFGSLIPILFILSLIIDDNTSFHKAVETFFYYSVDLFWYGISIIIFITIHFNPSEFLYVAE